MVNTSTTPARLDLVYRGAALEDGSMDVRDLGVAMLAVGGIFDSANQRLNGDRAAIDVRVKAMAPGSFEIAFDVIQRLPQAAWPDFLTDAGGVKELLFGALGGGFAARVGSLVRLLRWIGGRQVQTRELEQNRVEITVIDSPGAQVVVEGNLWHLQQDPATRRALLDLMRPITSEGVDSLAVREDGEILEVMTEEDVSSFIPRGEEELLQDEVRSMTFKITRLTFLANGKWQLSDGTTRYQVSIRDEIFAHRIRTNEVRFGIKRFATL